MSNYYSNIRLEETVYKELLPVFLEELEEEQRRLQEGVLATDLGVIKEVAHKVKGMALSYGAEKLAASAEEIELAVLEGRTEKLEKGVHQLREMMLLGFEMAEKEFQILYQRKK